MEILLLLTLKFLAKSPRSGMLSTGKLIMSYIALFVWSSVANMQTVQFIRDFQKKKKKKKKDSRFVINQTSVQSSVVSLN